MRKLGFWMICLSTIAWFSVGGCQRPVVSSPEPAWRGANRWPITPVPQPHEITPPPAAVPPLLGANLWKPSAPLRDWKHIVIHHSASESGSVESIHAAHLGKKDKNGKKWLGIGYHFVIGNGKGMGDGEIEPTFRWRQQLHGAHAGNEEYNQHGIGVCVVGNFENHAPSTAQLTSLKQLVAILKRDYHINGNRVVGHREVKSTACPGKLFPLAEISQAGDESRLGQFEKTSPPAVAHTEGRTFE